MTDHTLSIPSAALRSHHPPALTTNMTGRLFKFCTIKITGRVLDVIVLVLVIGGLSLSYSGLIRPRGAGFYCDDETIKFPYRGDTVSVVQLFLGSLLAPILFILPIELVKKWRKSREEAVRSYFLSAWRTSWSVWRAVLLGNLAVLVLTEISKSLISEARPHFWDTCQPNVTKEICDSGYIVEFNCTSDYSNRKILDAQKSFPSGHTSVSFFAAAFMMWYLDRAVQWRHSYFFKPCLQLVWACFAILCALTRITDRRHHWWDVLAGGTLGLSVAFMLVQAVSKNVRWGHDDSDSGGNDSTNQFKDSVSSNRVDFQLKSSNNPAPNNKRPSVRRLLSTSSAATTIAEDSEINI
ncbi:Lipid phosphate phosphohydrolase 1 [Daphnia magna]|uniref:Lipid phosphate phosphohydrolase 1 n=1 Tax=Daphnia magna TaxID=35525 RepID=A0A164S6G0_9CRUS|nr:Lipid phosphate phosphohydrolase 1 [Daphnia magna]